MLRDRLLGHPSTLERRGRVMGGRKGGFVEGRAEGRDRDSSGEVDGPNHPDTES